MPRKSDQIKEAITVLKQGGVVLFPTETAYGLAADARNARAVRRVSEIKGREPGKTPPLIAADRKMAEEYVEISDAVLPLVEAHWPGALTVVGKVGKGLASGAVRRDGTVAVRVSSHPVARALSKGLGAPIVATSANVSGLPPCYSVRTFERQLKAKAKTKARPFPLRPGLGPDFMIDVGPIPYRKPSTIVTEKKGKLVVLRQGSVTV